MLTVALFANLETLGTTCALSQGKEPKIPDSGTAYDTDGLLLRSYAGCLSLFDETTTMPDRHVSDALLEVNNHQSQPRHMWETDAGTSEAETTERFVWTWWTRLRHCMSSVVRARSIMRQRFYGAV